MAGMERGVGVGVLLLAALLCVLWGGGGRPSELLSAPRKQQVHRGAVKKAGGGGGGGGGLLGPVAPGLHGNLTADNARASRFITKEMRKVVVKHSKHLKGLAATEYKQIMVYKKIEELKENKAKIEREIKLAKDSAHELNLKREREDQEVNDKARLKKEFETEQRQHSQSFSANSLLQPHDHDRGDASNLKRKHQALTRMIEKEVSTVLQRHLSRPVLSSMPIAA